jgi:hypothetical protein
MHKTNKQQVFKRIVRIVKDLNPDKRLKSKDKALLIRLIEKEDVI